MQYIACLVILLLAASSARVGALINPETSACSISALTRIKALTVEQEAAVTTPLARSSYGNCGDDETISAVRVQAGPGSGKTRVIIHRIEYLLAKECVSTRNMLALTFTRKAAEEMKGRLEAKVGDSHATELLTVCTLHSFCVRLLRDFSRLCGVTNRFSIYDDDDGKRIVKGLLAEHANHPDGEGCEYTPAKVYERLSELKRSGIGREQPIGSVSIFTGASSRMVARDQLLTHLALTLLPSYDSALMARHALDFDDLIEKAYHLLRLLKNSATDKDLIGGVRRYFGGQYLSNYRLAAPEPSRNGERDGFEDGAQAALARDLWALGERIQEKYRHILVDEWQDVDTYQYALIHELCRFGATSAICGEERSRMANDNDVIGEGGDAALPLASARSLFVVGDADQTIYGWRGASTKTMENFPVDYPQSRAFSLTRNFRCDGEIVACANGVIGGSRRHSERMEGDGRPTLCESAPGALPERVGMREGTEERGVDVVNCYNDAAQAQFLVDMVLYLVGTGTFQAAQIAVLYRKHSQVLPVEAALVTQGVSYKLSGGPSFLEKKSVKDIMAYLRVVLNPADVESLRRIINFPRRGLGAGVQDLFLNTLPRMAEASSSDADNMQSPLRSSHWTVVTAQEAEGLLAAAPRDAMAQVQTQGRLMSLAALDLVVAFAGYNEGRARKDLLTHIVVAQEDKEDLTIFELSTRQVLALREAGQLFLQLRSILLQTDSKTDDNQHVRTLYEYVHYVMTRTGLLDASTKSGSAAEKVKKDGKQKEKRPEVRIQEAQYSKDMIRVLELVNLHEKKLPDAGMVPPGSDDSVHSRQRAGGERACLEEQVSAFLDSTQLGVEEEEDSKCPDPAGKVQLMSVHASKGLEYDCVFILGVEEGSIPSVRGGVCLANAQGKARKKKVCIEWR